MGVDKNEWNDHFSILIDLCFRQLKIDPDRQSEIDQPEDELHQITWLSEVGHKVKDTTDLLSSGLYTGLDSPFSSFLTGLIGGFPGGF